MIERYDISKVPKWHEIAREYYCHTCDAPPGKPCITTGGQKKFEVHADRSHQAASNNWQLPKE